MKTILLFIAMMPIFATPSRNRAVTTKDEANRIEIAHKIVDGLVKGDYAKVRENFDQSLSDALSNDKLAQGWQALTGQIGNYVQTNSTTTDVVQSYNQVKVNCKFANGTATVEVTFSVAEKVIGLYLKP